MPVIKKCVRVYLNSVVKSQLVGKAGKFPDKIGICDGIVYMLILNR